MTAKIVVQQGFQRSYRSVADVPHFAGQICRLADQCGHISWCRGVKVGFFSRLGSGRGCAQSVQTAARKISAFCKKIRKYMYSLPRCNFTLLQLLQDIRFVRYLAQSYTTFTEYFSFRLVSAIPQCASLTSFADYILYMNSALKIV